MGAGYVLIYVILCANLAYRFLLTAYRDWRLHFGLLVEYTLLGGLFAHALATGRGGTPLWCVLDVSLFLLVLPAPWLLQRIGAGMAGQNLFGPARLFALVSYLLAWSKENLFVYQFYTGLSFLGEGRVEEADRYFGQVIEGVKNPDLRAVALGQLVSLHGAARRWKEAAALHERFRETVEGRLRPEVLLGLVRAHGETADFARALECQRALEEGRASVEQVALGRVLLLGLAGRPDEVRRVFADHASVVGGWPRSICPYWIGRAHLAAGEYAEAGVLFDQALRNVPRGERLWRSSIEEQLAVARSSLPPIPRYVEPPVAEAIDRFAATPVHTRSPHAYASFATRRKFYPVTVALLVANVLVYVLMERAGSPQDERLVMRFGGMVPGLLWANHEYWRSVTHMFVHLNPLHIFFNAYALYIFGNFLEGFYGARRLLILYVFSGLGAIGLSLVFFDPAVPGSAGASGAVCGLMGVALAFALRHKRQIPPGIRRFLIFNFVVILALVVGGGYLIGRLSGMGVDNWAHMGGGASGFALAFLVTPERFLEKKARAGRSALWAATWAAVALLAYGAMGLAENVATGGYPRSETRAVRFSSQEGRVELDYPAFWTALPSGSLDRSGLLAVGEPWETPDRARLIVLLADDMVKEEAFGEWCASYMDEEENRLRGHVSELLPPRPHQRGTTVEEGGLLFFLHARGFVVRVETPGGDAPYSIVRHYYFHRTEEGAPLVFLFEFPEAYETDYETLARRILASVRRGG